MKLRNLLSSIVLVSVIFGCDSRKTLKMTEQDVHTLDSLGYKVYPYKKDKQGNYYLDTTSNKPSDSINSNTQ